VTSAVPSIPSQEYLDRQRTLAADAAARGLDGLLVWSTGGSALDGYADVFYLTNHYTQVPRVNIEIPGYMTGWGQTALILPSSGDAPTLIVESGDWRRDLVVAEHVRDSLDLYAEVIAALKDAGLARAHLGLVGESVMPASAWRQLSEALPQISFERADDILALRRMIKSDAEIEMMRHACAVGAAIQNAMLPLAMPGANDGVVAAAGTAAACEHGAVPWDFAFASGPHSGHGYWGRLPAWDRQRTYELGDIVHPDAYGSVNGYFYDLQRTVIVGGEPSAPQRRLLDGVVDLVDALCAACLPGTPVADVARLRETWLAKHGIEMSVASDEPGEQLTPLAASGHGVGTGFELPWVIHTSQDVIQPGMTIAMEVYISDPSVGTVVNEEILLVTDAGPEILTSDCPARRW
jgi:Xaa-Pro aminopeptidase